MKRIKLFLMAAALVGGSALLSSCGNEDTAVVNVPELEGDVEISTLTATSFQFELPEGNLEIEVEYYE